MPLHSTAPTPAVLEGSDFGARRARRYAETVRGFYHSVTMRHPNALNLWLPTKELGLRIDCRLGSSELGKVSLMNYATKCFGHCLEAVTDAEYGNPRSKESRIGCRGTLLVDALRTPGQDDCCWMTGQDVSHRQRMRYDFAVNMSFSNPPGDQLGILSAVIHDEDQSGQLAPGRRRRSRWCGENVSHRSW